MLPEIAPSRIPTASRTPRSRTLSIAVDESSCSNCIDAGPSGLTDPGGIASERCLKFLDAFALLLVLFLAALCSSQAARAQFAQQGPKLIGSGGQYLDLQGTAVALSGDGRTALVGGPEDTGTGHFLFGATWVFARNGNIWNQQGGLLIGSGAVAGAKQGSALALSSDGNTAIIGGPTDNGNTGAVWVFTRSNGVWTQQGSKLVPQEIEGPEANYVGASVALSADGNTVIIGVPLRFGDGGSWVFTRSAVVWTQQSGRLLGTVSGNAQLPAQGTSVAISADGNTAIVGGPRNGNSIGVGGAWIFVRTAGVWTQQGSELIGTGAIGASGQGTSVALSADGNTAFVGGPTDNGNVGAVWAYTRSEDVWTQQGNKLIGAGAVGGASQGTSVASSGDGNMLVVGGPADNSNVGAIWVFTRTGNVWGQQGAKLVGAEVGTPPTEGSAVGVSNDGNTVIIGGPLDSASSSVGGAWFFAKVNPTNTHDVNGDGVSDITWRYTGGNLATWLINDAGVGSTGGLGTVPGNWSIVGQRDFDGDGKTDILWRDTAGDISIWFMNGTQVSSTAGLGNVPSSWSVLGTADFNGDGHGDILWRDTGGNTAIWLMNGATVLSSSALGNTTNWTVVGTGDFNGDGMADILWQDGLGDTSIWFMSGATVSSSVGVGNVPTSWVVAGTGDFDGDGMTDIVWRNTTGDVAIWLMSGATALSTGGLGVMAPAWAIIQTGDYNGDGKSDLLWRDTAGDAAIWLMNGIEVVSGASVGNISSAWAVQGINTD
jgi:hypothetical protein